jgi:formylmethanofuran dehydrogenase subunit B
LTCDDLVIARDRGQLRVRANGCPISVPAFEQASLPAHTTPRVRGRSAALDEAIAEAAGLLRGARQPLFAGLGTDVAGVRAAARLADRCGGVLDHMHSSAALRNVLAFQDSGWITTTLSEVRNRADLLVVAGTDVITRFPRFFERCVANRQTLFAENRRCEVVFVGCTPPDGLTLPEPPTSIPCARPRLHEAFGLVRALAAGRRPQVAAVAGVPLPVWQDLAARMRSARYGVLVWAAADLDFPQADLVVQAMCELLGELNSTTRFSGLPLGGNDGELTSESVQVWQTGYGSRTGFGRGYPDADPYHYSTPRLLDSGEADVLFWISSFDATRTPPPRSVPTVVLGRAGMAFDAEPEVFVPVGTPGIDHAGHLFRTDRVVALPLRRLRDSDLPAVAQVLGAIETAI